MVILAINKIIYSWIWDKKRFKPFFNATILEGVSLWMSKINIKSKTKLRED